MLKLATSKPQDIIIIIVHESSDISQSFYPRQKEGRKEGKVFFNDALNTLYLWLYGVGHTVKDYSDSEQGNLLLSLLELLFPISNKKSFICTIP